MTTKPSHLRIIDTSAELAGQPEPDDRDRAFAARQLVQATLPHRTPRGNPPIWSRTNGNYTLSIRPGWKRDKKTGEQVCIGYPFGSIPRLLLFWITTEVLRTGKRRIELGDTLADFMRQLGLDPSRGGKRSDAKRLREQMERLFRATISFDYNDDPYAAWLDMQVAPKGELWWDPKQPDQTDLFSSWIELGDTFFDALTSAPVPVDMRALKALKQSPLALDLYAWVAYRSHRVNESGNPAFVPWRSLKVQFGGDYSSLRDFRRYAKEALHKIRALYPHLKVYDVDGGIQIDPGYSLIRPR